MEVLKTGTTTLGITAGNYVIMGTDSRATMGNFISNKNAQKLYKIDTRRNDNCRPCGRCPDSGKVYEGRNGALQGAEKDKHAN